MRQQRMIELEPGRTATVREARTGHWLALLESDAELDLDARTLIRQHGRAVLGWLADCIDLPPGETLDDLPLSELLDLVEIWFGLNDSFFGRLLSIIDPDGSAPIGSQPLNSLAPLPSSPLADSIHPGTMAGASSASASI